ncbi:MAG: methyltransferase domain-containing protein [Candidatus Methanoperedens sp.]|nr:methyltransferase domain-containing protein [Candidatus Methanoperedens sp.]MCE8424329.1 methyltransferase domain-containing protein [Candidatus Methanoperedens sp.]MCE8427662.1 methyltransferase domain-containing protein [Candidatus Methanoperedens sp.]
MSSSEEIDLERAIEDADKIVLLGSALKTGIFSALAGEKDIAELVSELNANERALFIVLEALCSLGFVNREKNRYIITDKARFFFVERGEDYLGDYLPHALNKLKAWLDLPLIIKGEKPGKEAPTDVPSFMKAMSSRPDKMVEFVVDECIRRKKDAKTALDLGGGPGKYARTFVKKGMEVVLYDMPETIDYVSMEFGLKDIRNLTLKKGDFTEHEFADDFQDGSFDIVFMGNICHIYSEEENIKLIGRAGKILKKGGLLAIEDFVRGRSPEAEMFAVNMLASTIAGGTWTEEQYREWLKVAGFSKIEVLDFADGDKQLITAILESK